MKKLNIILFLICSVLLQAQQLKVSVDKNPAIVGEQIVIKYTIETKGKDFKSPNFTGLKVLSGPNPSTKSSYSYVNGESQSTSSTSYSFYLQAVKEGTYNISQASVSVNGKTIKSAPYSIQIVKSAKKNREKKNTLSKDLFVKAEVSKRQIVVGEQVLVTYKLFTRRNDLHNTELISLPNLNGFWSKDLESSSKFKRNVINGIAYNVATIKKSVLTAQKSGKLSIDPMELKCSIRIQKKRNNSDPFANFFGNGYNLKEKIIRSKPITIEVTELVDKPANFNGAVGEMSISSTIDKTIINANEAVTYKLTITGKGNIELIEPLNVKFPENFEVYEPKITAKIFEGGIKRSKKIFEYLLIPRYEGIYNIPSITLITFNNKKNIFVYKRSNSHTVEILPSINNEQEDEKIKQYTIQTNQKDINHIALESNLETTDKNSLNSEIFLILLLLPILILLGLWIFNTSTLKNGQRSNAWKNKKANKVALKKLKNSQKCINKSNFDGFFEEIEKSLWGYFADKFKIQIADLSKETISHYFKSSEISNSIENQFIKLLDECEAARYSQSKNKNFQMDNVLKKAKNIIIEVETALK